MSQFLTLDDVKIICFEYAKSHLAYSEPLPSFETRYEGVLETALHAPQQSAYGEMMHKTLPEQAAVLFYEMCKLHPFVNGNKRMACVSLFVFLALNEKWLPISWRELYDLALLVASSPAENRQGMLGLLTEFIGGRLENKK